MRGGSQVESAKGASRPDLPSAEGASPALAQWFAAKEAYPDALLFFRMGDFYELFFTDAERAAAALDIALTHRGTHQGRSVPMCGVPVATAELYLGRLIRQGHRVAIVEQTEAPRPGRSAKGPIRREVVRLVTPGTLTEEGLLEPARPQRLAAFARRGAEVALAWLDLAGGEFATAALAPADLPALLAALDPAEIIAAEDEPLPPEWEARRSAPPLALSDPDRAAGELARLYEVASPAAFGVFSEAETIAAALAALYVEQSHGGRFPPLPPPKPEGARGRVMIDPASRRSLGLALPPSDPASLQSALGRTRSAAGLRLLGEWIASPLTDLAEITARAEAWSWLLAHPGLIEPLQRALAQTPDLARAVGRIAVGRALPRDLAAVRDAARQAGEIAALFPDAAPDLPPRLEGILALLRAPRPLGGRLAAALAPELPARFEEGEVIGPGFDAALDRERALRDEARRFVAELERELAARFAVPQLRIRHHAQLGYVIELPRAAAARLRDEPALIFRQATAQGGRFTTPPLLELEQKLAEAAAAAQRREQELIAALLAEALAEREDLTRLARALAELDVFTAAADLARREGWCRPVLGEDLAFRIKAGRHPVVAAALGREARFVPNDCDLSPPRRLALLTGPNMAGKSTYLRQNALIAVLAQAGLPVPAREAEIGLVDKIFSRVGADDDLVRGRSTFLVEMTETAAILHQATPRSLVIVDEIGRGTATLDGLAIAWAVLEALHDRIRARTLFATHFHELGRLAGELPHLVPLTMKVAEHRGRVVFLHEVVEGAANRSFGVHVARLAGVPGPVVARAAQLLEALEARAGELTLAGELPLFAAARLQSSPPQSSPHQASSSAAQGNPETEEAWEEKTPPEPPPPDPRSRALEAVAEMLAALDPDQMTPREALAALYELRARLPPSLSPSLSRRSVE